MIREDFLERMIRQIAETIAAAMGLAREGKVEEAIESIEAAYRTYLGMPKDMVDRLDAATVVATFGAQKAIVIAALLDGEAKLDAERAAELAARANAIRAAIGL